MISSLKKFGLVIVLYMYALVRGRATGKRGSERHAHPRIKTVLIVQMAKLGDMVCTTPMFRAVKAAHPEAAVAVLGHRSNRALLADSPDVDRYIVFEGISQAIREVKAGVSGERFDAVFLAGGPDIVTLAIAFLAGVPLIVAPHIEGGFSPWNTWLYRAASVLVTRRPHRMGEYVPRQYLRLLEPAGIEANDTTKRLAFSKEAEATAARLLSGMKKPIVGISPSAGNAIKNWPADRFAKVAGRLISEKGASIVVVGGPKDAHQVKAMILHMVQAKNPEQAGDKVLDLQGKLSLDELKAVIASMDLFIAVDTGPIYVAEAFGVATIDIVGPMDEREQPPIGSRHRVVLPPGRAQGKTPPVLHIMNARLYNYDEARRQVESITADMVIQETHGIRLPTSEI